MLVRTHRISMNSTILPNPTTLKTIQISNLLRNEEIQEEEAERIINKNKKRGKYMKKFLLKSPIYFSMIALNRIFKRYKKYNKEFRLNKETKKYKRQKFEKQKN